MLTLTPVVVSIHQNSWEVFMRKGFTYLLAGFIVVCLSTMVYAAVAKWIFVPNAASKTLSFVDPQKDMVIGHCETGATGWLACLTPDLKKIYVGENGGD
jgi:hypothetical protein